MNIRKLDLHLLSCLDALMAERNVTRAAARMHLSQPAMSSALKRLRDIFRDPLLTRSQRGMAPTPRGIELAEKARAILQGVVAMTQATPSFDPATSQRTFRIAMTDYTEFVLLPALTQRLQTQAPRVNLAVTAVNIRTHADELADGELDLAIAHFRATPGRLRSAQLFRERFVCLVSRQHAKVGARLTLKKFTELPHAFISPRGGGFYGAADNALAKMGLSRRIAVSVPHFLVAPFVVASSELIMVMAERIAQHYAQALPLRILKPPLAIDGFGVSQLWHERTDHDAGAEWLRGLIKQVSR